MITILTHRILPPQVKVKIKKSKKSWQAAISKEREPEFIIYAWFNTSVWWLHPWKVSCDLNVMPPIVLGIWKLAGRGFPASWFIHILQTRHVTSSTMEFLSFVLEGKQVQRQESVLFGGTCGDLSENCFSWTQVLNTWSLLCGTDWGGYGALRSWSLAGGRMPLGLGFQNLYPNYIASTTSRLNSLLCICGCRRDQPAYCSGCLLLCLLHRFGLHLVS